MGYLWCRGQLMTGVVCALAGGKSKDLVLTTVSFTSNSTWVAPSGVDLVVSAAGKGSAGISDYEGQVAGRQFTAWGFDTPFNVNAPYAQWANIYNSYATVFSQLNLSYPSYGPSALATDYLVFLSANDYWGAITFSPTDLSTTLLTSYDVVVSGSPKTRCSPSPSPTDSRTSTRSTTCRSNSFAGTVPARAMPAPSGAFTSPSMALQRA